MLALILAAAYRRWGVLLLTVIAIALADLAAGALKVIVDRPRPFARYAEPKVLVPRPHDASFPSGHAATSFAAATILSLAFPTAAPAFLVVAAAVAYSRIYVGVHYPLDVLGGAALGAAIAAGMWKLAGRLRRASPETS